MKILCTGVGGFIGSQLFGDLCYRYPEAEIVGLDALKYSGFSRNIDEVLNDYKNARFKHVDLSERDSLENVFKEFNGFDNIFHLAAESAVDKSVYNYADFIQSNILGSCNLFSICSSNSEFNPKIFINMITDEVYGHLATNTDMEFEENTPLRPRNIYSASKASQYHFGMAFFHTHELNVVSVMPSNNYGPRQLPEKLLPRMIYLIANDQELPVYGDGLNIREWLFVSDTSSALSTVMDHGIIGENYNIGSSFECSNNEIISKLGEAMGKKPKIKYIEDRPGHDFRYSVDYSKLEGLGFSNQVDIDKGLEVTVKWYMDNFEWLKEQYQKVW